LLTPKIYKFSPFLFYHNKNIKKLLIKGMDFQRRRMTPFVEIKRRKYLTWGEVYDSKWNRFSG
jgi:hypothetical protein